MREAYFAAADGTKWKDFLYYLSFQVFWDLNKSGFSRVFHTKEWKKLGARDLCVRAALVTLFWITSVLASFLIVYLKLPIDVVLSALANLGVSWAKSLTTYIGKTRLGKFLALSNQSRTQQKFMKLIEQLVEALPQLVIAVIYCIKNWAYIWLTEVDGESLLPLPSSVISPIFSAVSIVMGIFNGVTACIEMRKQRALQVAADKGDVQEVQRLIDFLKKSELNVDYMVNGYSALMKASQKGQTDIVKILLDAGANNDLQDSFGDSALVWASMEGHSNCVKMLLDAGANTDLQSRNGWCALMAASRRGHPVCVKLLLNAGANRDLQNSVGCSALILASSWNHPHCVKLLLNAGANTELQDSDGASALVAASKRGHPECVKLLLDAGVNTNLQKSNGASALIEASKEGHSDCVKLILTAGANLLNVANLQNSDGLSAPMSATRNGYFDCVSLLCDAGANKDLKDEDNKTAFDYAKTQEIQDLLLKQ